MNINHFYLSDDEYPSNKATLRVDSRDLPSYDETGFDFLKLNQEADTVLEFKQKEFNRTER